jgi:outer membrane protein OmpA-like peptidoglycan-associated protein
MQATVFAIFIAGCATVSPPKELLDARAADKRASAGVTAELDPADLHSAKESLAEAEHVFSTKGDTRETRDLSYASDLRFQTAESRARTIATTRERDRNLVEMQANVAAFGQRTAAQLGQANQQLATQGQALRTEQQLRLEAEKRATQAAADLARLGAVTQEPRGMVLTLSGGVLFVTNKAELLPSAQIKLNEVAEALIKQDPDSTIVVEGYTDSQGSAAHNQELSDRRAQAVRDYLVSRGIASDRITAQGFGLTRPVADNGTAEGRANNRRVEIVVKPGK